MHHLNKMFIVLHFPYPDDFQKVGAEDENLTALASFLHVWVAAEKEVAKLNRVIPASTSQSISQFNLKVQRPIVKCDA